MHAGLFFFLWVGVQWQSTEPVAVEAEVWDLKVQSAAPPAPPPVEAEPAPTPPPTPVEAPPPPPPQAAPVEPPAETKQADIALERKKAKLKAEQEKHAEELKRKEQQRLEQQEKQDKLDKLEKQKEKEKAEKADKAAKLAKEKEKEKAEAKAEAEAEAKAEKEAAEKKAAAEKAAKAKRAAAEQKAADKAREAEMSRITGAVGSGTSGTAAKSTAPRSDSGYVAAITAKIKSNIAYSGSTDVPGAQRAVYKIEQLPTGEIISVRKIKSSGIAAYDSAVENAIAKSSPLPKKKDGTVDRSIEAVFDIKDKP
ncbi:protein TolA [Janthinobacterium agaricidamnosum NBRC 102515 = DSM 9628]|uniref:Protein TolA n=2 Tax=Janthinobacterium agaricidamnosum TaxID=55508 RepID=W0VB09_9BURK|nr:protein TolA [Janthinobacterium agaricidamnosum NBRC 102515 = DSM 9628]